MASQPPGRWPAETRAIRRVGAPLCRDVLASRGGKITLRRPRVRLHPDPGHCDYRDRAGGGPVPIQPLPGGTQFARTMPELGRQHRYMGAAPNPRTLTGRFGASSHVLRFPCGLSSGFPFAHPGSSPSFAVPWLPLVRRPPVRSLRPSLSGSVPLRVPFPLSSLHVSAAARRFCRRWSRCRRDQDHQFPARSLARIAPDSPATQMLPGSGSGRAARPAASLPTLGIS
jgi:hypothetical protein